jgi:hypothetical protein
LLSFGDSIEKISQVTGLSIDTIGKLKGWLYGLGASRIWCRTKR